MTSSTIQHRQHENRRQYFSLADSTVYRKYIIYSTLFNKTEHLMLVPVTQKLHNYGAAIFINLPNRPWMTQRYWHVLTQKELNNHSTESI